VVYSKSLLLFIVLDNDGPKPVVGLRR
jgi:hypothetical protein